MADQAQRPDIAEIAFAAAFDYRDDMIRVPQRFAIEAFQTPAFEQS